MSRLIRRRQVQTSLEDAEKEMGGKTWSLSELESLLSEDGIIQAASTNHAQRIASDEQTRFLLVRDISKAIQDAKNVKTEEPVPAKSIDISNLNPVPSTSTLPATDDLGDEFDLDVQRAIQMSLSGSDIVEEILDDEKTCTRIKLNSKQRQMLGGTLQTHGLVRGFMMEYAEMNDTDIHDLFDCTQDSKEVEVIDEYRAQFPNNDEYVLYGSPEKSKSNETKEKKNVVEIGVISDSDSDSDLEEVTNDNSLKDINKNSNELLITVASDLKSYIEEEDLFADIFQNAKSLGSSKNVSPIKMLETDTAPDVVDFISSPDSSQGTLPYDYSEVELIADSGSVTEDSSEINEPLKTNFEPLTEVEEISDRPKIDEIATSVAHTEDKFDSPNSIQRTPTKLNMKSSHETPPKVASPFFVNRKSPKSKQKYEHTSPLKTMTVSKDLFHEPPQKVKLNPQAAIKIAVAALKEKKTESELKEMANELVKEQKSLVLERNKQERMGTSITDNMSRECKELLKLFGIPYVDSPMEAEAQCAFLNMIKLTDGTISDDSDIWLFGGQTVYKNFFVQKKMVMEFQFENIEKMFNLDRKKLIQLAMLVGSDYTTGINGVGAVTALEILAAFPTTPIVPGETDEYQSMISSLRKFREWFNNGKPVGALGKTVLKSKLKNIELFEGFPNLNVARAYLEPVIDDNKENFSWGLPDTESLIEFAKIKLGWTRSKTDEILEPVMKRLNEKKQTTMKDYFKSQVTKKCFDSGTMSKRVKKAVGMMAGDVSDDEPKKKDKNPRKQTIKRKKEAVESDSFKVPDEDQNIMLELSEEDDMNMQPPTKLSKTPEKLEVCKKTSKVTKQAPVKKTASRKRKQDDAKDVPKPSTSTGSSSGITKTPRIPNTKQVIPQREKDKEDQKIAKQKAIAMFKKSKPSADKNN